MTDIIRLKQQEAVLRLLFQNEHKDVEKRLRAQKECGYETRLFND